MKSANTAVLAITQTFTAHSGRNTTRRRGSIFSQRGGSERLPGNGSPPGTRFLLAAKESSQRKLPLFRRSGLATWGLHAPKTPKAEVAEGAGYANAVLLFALNARALCSDLKFGRSPEPPLPETAVRRGRACPARSLASAPGFVLHPLYLLHRREGLRGCEQGPRLSGAKPGCEQCLPLRGKQPHERVCEANWRRSLCAAKR